MDDQRVLISCLLTGSVYAAYVLIPPPVLFAITFALDMWEYLNLKERSRFMSFGKPVMELLLMYLGIVNIFTMIFMATNLELMFDLVVLVSISDAMQYIFGTLLGYHSVGYGPSPHKTWEGYLGAVVSALIGSYVLGTWISINIVISGVVGDLFMSMIKRDMRIKDTSGLLLSHGGWLDRTDGIKMAIITTCMFFNRF
jgi:CDP-diglyceride synthetase